MKVKLYYVFVCVFEGEGGGSVDGDEHLGIVPLIFMVKC